MNKILPLIIMILFLFNNAYSGKKDIRKIREAYKRMMEWAHPTPDPNLIDKFPKVPRLQSGKYLPIFLNSNTIDDEANESFKMQNESSIAVNPTNPLNLIASAVDYRDESATWVYVSQDGARTWKNVNLGRPYPGWRSTNDPSVAFAIDGTGYSCYGGFGTIDTTTDLLVGENGVFLSKTTDGGKTWKSHIPVIVHTGTQTLDSNFEDKYYIHVDNSPVSPYFGHLYIPWKRVTPKDSATQIVISKSTDKGETWSTPIPVSPRKSGTSEDTTYGQSFPLAITGPGGEVYCVWNDGIVHGVGFAKSIDGGKTFSAPKIIFNYNIFGITKYIPGQGGYRHTVKGKVRAEAYPVIACDLWSERKGYLYLTWAADSVPNIYFSRSTDGGETWSIPIIIHETTKNDQFWQWIAVDPKNGDIAVMYFDSRDDDSNIMVNCYVSYSRDGGLTWIDRRVGDEDHDLRLNPFLDNAFAGDYSGVAFFDGIIYPSWVDMRNAVSNIRDSDVFTAIVNTRAPLPVENFKVSVFPEQTDKLKLTWDNPTKFTFGQPMQNSDYTLLLYRDNKFIKELQGGTNEFVDENLEDYKYYTYSIFVKSNNDTSVVRRAMGNPGGSRNPLPPTIISQKSSESSGKISFELDIKFPTMREDGITPLVDLDSVLVYLDGKLELKVKLEQSDTGKVKTIKGTLSESYPVGFYRVISKIITKKGIESLFSNDPIFFFGNPINVTAESRYFDDFDAKTPKKYWWGSKWNYTDEFSYSKPNSITESPKANYTANSNDTLMLFPFVCDQQATIKFWHAAIVDPNDLALAEYSTDGGLNWSSKFENIDASFNKSQYDAWKDGYEDERDWIMQELHLPKTNNRIDFRLRFSSNNFRHNVGWFLDNLEYQVKTLGVDNNHKNEIQIYPTITKGYLNILQKSNIQQAKIEVYSIEGTLVFEYSLNKEMDILDLSMLPVGIYYVVVQSPSDNWNEKILIIK